MTESSLARPDARLSGVIDTLSRGYEVINRHPWVLLIPILLDVFLWLGPQFTAAQLVSQALGRAVPLIESEARTLVISQAQQQDIVQAFEQFNLLATLASWLVGVPSLVAVLGIRDPVRSAPVESWGLVVLILGSGTLGGMLLGSFYYSILAQQIRDGAVSLVRLLGLAMRSWLRVLLFLLILAGLGTLFGLPIGFLAATATMASPALGSLAFSAVMMALIWTAIYLFFVPDAIFVSQVGPLQAIKNSVAVVRSSLWAAIGIVVLITVVLLGMGRVWELVSQRVVEPWGLGLGILGNAYIASGLVAASMCFYRERIEHLRPAPAASPEPPADPAQPQPDDE